MSRATAGYAYVGGACVRNVYLKKISSVALVEDSGGYSGVIVTAHEIGHLLGAVHDGDSSPSYLRGPGAKSCPWSQGFIMSDLRRTARGQLWSDCSVKQIRHFLKTTTASCLHNPPRHQDYSLPGPSSLPGTQLSLNAQCFADRGTRACYHDYRVCAQLFCYNRDYKGCYAYRPAVEGSSCGNGKMCIGGKCVKKSTRKTVSRKPNLIKMQKKQKTVTTEIPAKNAKTKTVILNMQISRKPKIKTETNLRNSYAQRTSKPKINPTKTKSTYKTTRKPTITTTRKPTTTTTRKPITTTRKQQNKTSKPSGKTNVSKNKNYSRSEGECTDSFSVLGSLSCVELFQRYAFHYCKRNKVIKKKCCKTFRKVCNVPR